jgi:hypothetical protein
VRRRRRRRRARVNISNIKGRFDGFGSRASQPYHAAPLCGAAVGRKSPFVVVVVFVFGVVVLVVLFVVVVVVVVVVDNTERGTCFKSFSTARSGGSNEKRGMVLGLMHSSCTAHFID